MGSPKDLQSTLRKEIALSLGGGGLNPQFQNHVQGMYGSFSTPAGKVDYLLTKARLGEDLPDPERRLTSHLVPVREVLQSEDLDFNQLLQRDLDDHRVAVNLVPYILNPKANGPAFFPPIVAVILPFAGQHPSSFADLADQHMVHDLDADLSWLEQDASNQVRIRRLAAADKSLHPINLGQMWWNPEFARLVVLDGQHRAMALLAIDRTIRKTWRGTGGERYRYFYENRIRDLLKGRKLAGLADVETPVVVIWFPELFGEGKEPHKAARKLFVDVNKEARQPSESRLILLSDNELLNVLTRNLLTSLRNDAEGKFLPLYAVEYDNPETKTTQSARWSAITNIHVLKDIVSRLIFGPQKYLSRVDQRFAGREADAERDAFMRGQLEVKSLFAPSILDADGVAFQRGEMGNRSFPPEAQEKLSKKFEEVWGAALLTLFSTLRPYADHAKALTQLKTNWAPDEAIGTLARDALFSGVGMYWTLRDSAEHFKEERHSGGAGFPKPDVVKAWEAIASKQSEFETLRSFIYLGSKSAANVTNCSLVFQTLNTHACQLGLGLTFGTVWMRARAAKTVGQIDLAAAISQAVNTWLTSGSKGRFDRRLAFAKNYGSTPLNVISHMDSPRAIQFRYFWLEILASGECESLLEGSVDIGELRKVRDEARVVYFNFWKNQQRVALRNSHPDWKDTQQDLEAEKQAIKGLGKALLNWFAVPDANFKKWLNDSLPPAGLAGGSDENMTLGSDTTEGAEPDPEIEDLLEE